MAGLKIGRGGLGPSCTSDWPTDDSTGSASRRSVAFELLGIRRVPLALGELPIDALFLAGAAPRVSLRILLPLAASTPGASAEPHSSTSFLPPGKAILALLSSDMSRSEGLIDNGSTKIGEDDCRQDL